MPKKNAAAAADQDYSVNLGDLDEDAPKVLSNAEARKLRDPLADLIVDSGQQLDRFLTWASVTHLECDIWEFTDDEAEKLADFLISRAKRSVVVAVLVRTAVDRWDMWLALAMVGVRGVQTGEYVMVNGVRIPDVARMFDRIPRPGRKRRAPKAAASAGAEAAAAAAHPGPGVVSYRPAPGSGAAASPAPGQPGRRQLLTIDQKAQDAGEAAQRRAAAAAAALRAPLTYAAPEALAGTGPDDVLARIAIEAEQLESAEGGVS